MHFNSVSKICMHVCVCIYTHILVSCPIVPGPTFLEIYQVEMSLSHHIGAPWHGPFHGVKKQKR